jgi:hypothetical protein
MAPSRVGDEKLKHSSKRQPKFPASRALTNTVRKVRRAIPYCSAETGQSTSPIRGSMIWCLQQLEVLNHKARALRASCMHGAISAVATLAVDGCGLFSDEKRGQEHPCRVLINQQSQHHEERTETQSLHRVFARVDCSIKVKPNCICEDAVASNVRLRSWALVFTTRVTLSKVLRLLILSARGHREC